MFRSGPASRGLLGFGQVWRGTGFVDPFFQGAVLLGVAGRGQAGSGLVRQGFFDPFLTASPGWVRRDLVGCGGVGKGMVGYSLVWHGQVRICSMRDRRSGMVKDATHEAVPILRADYEALIALVRMFEKSVIYEISKSRRSGDDEGASLKALTLSVIQSALAKVAAP